MVPVPAAGLRAAAAVLLVLGVAVFLRRGVGPAFLLSAVFVAGLAIGHVSERRYASRRAGRLPEAGLALETEFLGRVRGLPERTAEGEHLLVLSGHPTGDDPAVERPFRVRLVVTAGSEEARARIERLGTGDLVRVWARLVVPRGYGNPGYVAPGEGLRARGLDAVGRVKSGLLIELVAREGRGPIRWVEEAKREARRRLDAAAGASGPARAILGAVLLGDRAGIPAHLLRCLRSAGLVHLVAISGLHVGLLAALCLGTLRRLRLWNSVLLAVSCLMLPAFGWAVGLRPPIARAALAAALALAGRCAGREGDPVNGLTVIAAVIAVANPAALLDAGFQLSFLATAGILLCGPALARTLPGPPWLALGVAVSSSAYLWAAPVAAWHFRWLAPVGLASNLAAAPLCALLLTSGYGAIVFHGTPLIGEGLGALAGTAAEMLLRLASFVAGFDAGGWRVPRPAVPVLVLYYAALCALLLPDRRARRRRGPWIAAAMGSIVIWLHVGSPPRPCGAKLESAVIDVGQGQAVALRGPRGGAALVDAGGSAHPRFDPGERVVLPFLERWGMRRVDVLVASHGDIDHVGGVAAVLRELEVGELWLAPGGHRHPRLSALAALARERGVAVVLAQRGFRRRRGGLELRVLGPGRCDRGAAGNDRSLVLLAGTGSARLLIVGDLGASGEAALLAAGEDPAAAALVVGHHGAQGASGTAFLERVRARHAVISCGFRNRFGHPHPDTVKRIEASGARVWRTDRDGLVWLVAGEGGWEVRATRR